MGRGSHRGLVFRWTKNPTEGTSTQALLMMPGWTGIFFTMKSPIVIEDTDLGQFARLAADPSFEISVTMEARVDNLAIQSLGGVDYSITTAQECTCWQYHNRSSMQVTMLAVCARSLGRMHDLIRAKIPNTASRFNLPPPTPEEMAKLLVRF